MGGKSADRYTDARRPAPMTVSASTPRLRLTFWLYLASIAFAALNSPGRGPEPTAELATTLIGAALVGLAVLGRLWCSAFIAGRKDAELVRAGPYAQCRHPLYALSMLAGAGIGLLTGSLAATLVLVIALALLLRSAAVTEEAGLAQRHADTWPEYLRATPNRFWPRPLWPAAASLPAQVDLHPAVFRKAFVDAASFLALALLVVIARELQAGGLLPTLLRLP